VHNFCSVLFISQPWDAFGVPDLESDTLRLSKNGSSKFGVGVVTDVATFVEESFLRLVLAIKYKIKIKEQPESLTP
jgi:hypothetical protein